jgi:hypothetical protein
LRSELCAFWPAGAAVKLSILRTSQLVFLVFVVVETSIDGSKEATKEIEVL